MDEQPVRSVETDALRIAYVEHGPADGWPVILSHGFPYDVHAFDEAASILARAGARVIAPYTRGFGPTRFVSDAVMRSGQQAARGRDIVELADALGLERPILGGFDWGGNASCVAAALWPERIGGLVSYAGYDVIDVSRQRHPVAPSLERVFWYQHLFQTERGRECLTEHRRELCRMLWSEWSPGWRFDDATFARSAVAFDNPDFVDVVIHCYRWLFGLEAGDPALQPLRRPTGEETHGGGPDGDARRRDRPAEARRDRRSRRHVLRAARAPRHRCGTQPAAAGAAALRRCGHQGPRLASSGKTHEMIAVFPAKRIQ